MTSDLDLLEEPERLAVPSIMGRTAQGFRVPDLVFVRHDGSLLEVEIECSLKKQSVYDDILSNYLTSPQFDLVYLIGNTRAHLAPLRTVKTRIERAISANRTLQNLKIEIAPADMRWATSSPSRFEENSGRHP